MVSNLEPRRCKLAACDTWTLSATVVWGPTKRFSPQRARNSSTGPLTLFEPRPRLGGKPLKFQAVCRRKETAVPKGLKRSIMRLTFCGASGKRTKWRNRAIRRALSCTLCTKEITHVQAMLLEDDCRNKFLLLAQATCVLHFGEPVL